MKGRTNFPDATRDGLRSQGNTVIGKSEGELGAGGGSPGDGIGAAVVILLGRHETIEVERSVVKENQGTFSPSHGRTAIGIALPDPSPDQWVHRNLAPVSSGPPGAGRVACHRRPDAVVVNLAERSAFDRRGQGRARIDYSQACSKPAVRRFLELIIRPGGSRGAPSDRIRSVSVHGRNCDRGRCANSGRFDRIEGKRPSNQKQRTNQRRKFDRISS